MYSNYRRREHYSSQYIASILHQSLRNLDTALVSASAEPNVNSDPPTLEEVMKAVQRLKNGKAGGYDGISITAELCCWTDKLLLSRAVPASMGTRSCSS